VRGNRVLQILDELDKTPAAADGSNKESK